MKYVRVVKKPSNDSYIVVLHGLDGTACSMLPFCEAISGYNHDFGVVTYDLLGRGRCRKNNNHTPEAYVNQLERVRKFLTASTFVIVGYDFGSTVAYYYSMRYPARVARTVMVCPIGRNDTSLFRMGRMGIIDRLTLCNVVPRLKSKHSREWESGPPKDWSEAFEKIYRSAKFHDTLTKCLKQFRLHDVEYTHIPNAWVLSCGNDSMYDNADSVAESLGAEHVRIANAGHYCVQERPLDVASCVVSIVTSTP